MGILKIFKKQGQSLEIKQEIPVMEVEETGSMSKVDLEPIYVKSIELQNPAAIQNATEELNMGNIVIVDLGPLLNQNPGDAKAAVDQLKAYSQKIGGDVGKITDSKVIATPKFVKLQFKKSS